MSDLFKKLDKDLQEVKDGLAFHDKNSDKLAEQIDLSHKALNQWGNEVGTLQEYARSMVLNHERAVQRISALEGECDELRKEMYEIRGFLQNEALAEEPNEMDECTSDAGHDGRLEVRPKLRKKGRDNPLHVSATIAFLIRSN